MDKVIIYGLGKDWTEYRPMIEKTYKIIGYCDKDESKINGRVVRPEKLKYEMQDCDYVLITSRRYGLEILQELEALGIETEKIKLFFHQKESMSIWGGHMPMRGISYSANMEDIVIAELCERLRLDVQKLRYIELGTCDPVIGNNTFWFYQRGGSGVLVEAVPKLCELIKRMRPRDVVLNYAVYADDTPEIPFYISGNVGLSSLYKSHIQESDEWNRFGIKEEISVSTIHINEVFKMLNDECDLLSIDLEGYDLEALKSLNFEIYRPKIIIAEMNWCASPDLRDMYEKIANLLYEKDYLLYAQNVFNGIFCDKNFLI